MKSPYISKRYWNTVTTAMGASGDLLKIYDDLINFSLGDPDVTTDERIIQGAFQDALDGHTHYTNFYGDPELRKAICEYYKSQYSYEIWMNEVLVTTSACHGMWLVLEAILDDGDEVIIPSPFFTPYPSQIRLARGIPVMLELSEDNDYQYEVEKLRSLITNRTKAIVLNTPHNPTGSSLSRETLLSVSEVAKEFDLLVIADDIYTKFSFTEPFLPITTLPGMKERTITLGSFSKDYAMTGWRIGYILSTPEAITVMKDINENNVFTAPSISQRAAIHALALRDEVQPELVAKFKERVFAAYERIRKLKNMSVPEPKGTF